MSSREKLWTPGPWEYSKDVNVVWGDLDCSRSQPGCNPAVARMAIKHSDENIEANAQLISAAPDLMEALERMVYKNDAGSVAQAKAALAKAYGDSQ